LGIPFIMGIFGQEGFELLSLILSIHLPVMMTASVLLLTTLGGGTEAGAGLAVVIRNLAVMLLLNPLIVGILSGLLWRASGFAMPSLMERIVDALAGVAGPVALFAVGLGLSRFGVSGNI